MSIKVLNTNGTRAQDAAGELVNAIVSLVYDKADGRLPVATVIGALELAKMQILADQEGDQ